MINQVFLKPANIAVIVGITALSHFIARPLYNRVARKEA